MKQSRCETGSKSEGRGRLCLTKQMFGLSNAEERYLGSPPSCLPGSSGMKGGGGGGGC